MKKVSLESVPVERSSTVPPEAWRDSRRTIGERTDALVAAMTLREKVSQLAGLWVGASDDGGDVAPFQFDMRPPPDLQEIIPNGLGQLTRPFGTGPVDAAVGVVSLVRSQQRIMAGGRFGIPAIAHDECLSGFTAWGATAYPVPLAWGATFDPELIERMAHRIGDSMRSVGLHQGLAPVLDVARDHRWGRVEETIGEDPHLVATVGTAYVRGLESAGIIATLKHFAGYSASRAGRNLAPVSIGVREFSDVILPPFEMAVREGGVRSVMHSYSDLDGVPSASDESLLTGLLRDRWGFEGTLVADYSAINFLTTMHRVAETDGEAAAMALKAGVDVELPTIDLYSDPLVEEVESGRLDIAYIDRALRRVLAQKISLGMLDPGWSPLPAGWRETDLEDPHAVRGRVDLDTPDDRALARTIAERSVILLSNDGILPLDIGRGATGPTSIAVIGPCADDPMVLLGCYAFPNHVLAAHPGVAAGIDLPTIADAIRAEFADAEVSVATGVDVSGDDLSGVPGAVQLAISADLVIAVVGDRSGLFGRGTSGEGCDAEDLDLPGRQWQLLDALLGTGTPVIVCVVSGRPYTLRDAPERARAIVQAFLPGEEGGSAVAGVLSGRVNPSGRLPVSIPRIAGAQPATYLAPAFAQDNPTSMVDPSARYPFGYGLSYSEFSWSAPRIAGASALARTPVLVPIDGSITVSIDVANIGERAGTELVQLYLHDPFASVVQPVERLIAYRSVPLAIGESVRVEFTVHADQASFTGRGGTRIVEPGRIELRLAPSSGRSRFAIPFDLVGPVRQVDHTRVLTSRITVSRQPASESA